LSQKCAARHTQPAPCVVRIMRAMSLKNIDIGSALRRVADKRIEDAMKEGKFENLRGAGKPIDLEAMPADENARMTWWALRIMKNNDFTPDEIVWRKAIDRLKEELAKAKREAEVGALVRQVNQLVRKLNTMGTNAIKGNLAPLDEAEELRRFRERAAGR
jgi:hypothetical protein